jgi:hypothetical protein
VSSALANAKIGAYAGSAEASEFTAGNFANGLLSGAAGSIAGAATRSAIEGSNFGDNIIATLPDVIGSTIGNAVAGGIASRAAEAKAAERRAIQARNREAEQYEQQRDYYRNVNVKDLPKLADLSGDIRTIRNSVTDFAQPYIKDVRAFFTAATKSAESKLEDIVVTARRVNNSLQVFNESLTNFALTGGFDPIVQTLRVGRVAASAAGFSGVANQLGRVDYLQGQVRVGVYNGAKDLVGSGADLLRYANNFTPQGIQNGVITAFGGKTVPGAPNALTATQDTIAFGRKLVTLGGDIIDRPGVYADRAGNTIANGYNKLSGTVVRAANGDIQAQGALARGVGRAGFEAASLLVGAGEVKAVISAPRATEALVEAGNVAKGSSWLTKLRAGNDFNASRAGVYEANELYINKPSGSGYYRLDSYTPGEIVSRKFTQFGDIGESTAKNYIDEIGRKYAPGSSIANVPSSGALAGQELKGIKILEVPVQTRPVPQSVLDYAKLNDVFIRDINGVTYR